MTKLIDLDQYITVPITDDHGEYTVEITVGEFFKRFLPGEQLKVVDAIPVEWLRNVHKNWILTRDDMEFRHWLIERWQKEQGVCDA